MSAIASPLWRKFQAYQVFGANTNVGKTILSTILCRRARSRNKKDNIWYLKPVSTGPSTESDKWHLDNFTRDVFTQSIYQFEAPVSPHLAADTLISDQTLLKRIGACIKTNAETGPGFMLVETAGGPNSPGPSGTLQADLYRPLRLPVIYVADWRLGGISTSISGYESLKMRGYDVDGIAVLKDSYYRNYEYFQAYFKDFNVPLLAVSQPPEQTQEHDHAAMNHYYLSLESGLENAAESSEITQFTQMLQEQHDSRIKGLESMADEACQLIWYPFTQHKTLASASITTIDSAQGDYFQVFDNQKPPVTADQDTSLLRPVVDGSASWWTQGLGHANSVLSMSAAYAAGRYGHVMFASGIHQPALALAKSILRTLKNPRLSRVFYSDNGSTGTEVAVKMALKASCVRYGWNHQEQEVEIIGLKNSYHGDTMGSMDMSEPSIFNDKVQWYKGRGFWFDSPTVKMRKGKWRVEIPLAVENGSSASIEFNSLQDIFNPARDESPEAVIYRDFISSTLYSLTQVEQRRFGALILEPVVLGAGGMLLADPLFQRMLVNTIRKSEHLLGPTAPSSTSETSQTTNSNWTGLPIVADEVFTGLFRLGHPSPSVDLLHISPDISAHAKLLTGGLVPLAVTCASESIFEAFLSDKKEDALLHGHSYTAHAVGCAVAVTSLQLLHEANDLGTWQEFQDDWSVPYPTNGTISQEVGSGRGPKVWSVWSQKFVTELSHAVEKVDSVWALGSVLAISLRDGKGLKGYASNAAAQLQYELLHGEDSEHQGWAIHSRVLGNVLYLMSGQTTEMKDIRAWEKRMKLALGM